MNPYLQNFHSVNTIPVGLDDVSPQYRLDFVVILSSFICLILEVKYPVLALFRPIKLFRYTYGIVHACVCVCALGGGMEDEFFPYVPVGCFV